MSFVRSGLRLVGALTTRSISTATAMSSVRSGLRLIGTLTTTGISTANMMIMVLDNNVVSYALNGDLWLRSRSSLMKYRKELQALFEWSKARDVTRCSPRT